MSLRSNLYLDQPNTHSNTKTLTSLVDVISRYFNAHVTNMTAAFLEEFRHLKEIKLATKNFEDTHVIEGGGCGNLYKEFMMVSHYTHGTLVSLCNFVAMIMRRFLFMRCNGSLDNHLKVGALTWPDMCRSCMWAKLHS